MEIFDAIEPFAHAYTRNEELKVPKQNTRSYAPKEEKTQGSIVPSARLSGKMNAVQIIEILKS